jgi:FKBP-type peptidyl-prolyl cis-trans isomerase
MKSLMTLLMLVGLLVSCGPPAPATEQETPPLPPVNEDALLLRLSAYLSTDTSRAAREQNEIVDYAIENLLDVKMSNSGLFYSLQAEGDGETIAWGDYLTAHYKGYLLDGTVFADSRKQDRPLEFYVGNMIPAWNEGLPYAKVGGKLLLLVPSDLGYGADGLKTGNGRVIVPPYQLLAFEVEVLEKGE